MVSKYKWMVSKYKMQVSKEEVGYNINFRCRISRNKPSRQGCSLRTKICATNPSRLTIDLLISTGDKRVEGHAAAG
jgi:hypothetical protein